ncbi:SMP-30/gluconolactonase/LRE family protein [Microbacterium sp. JZ70]
MTDATGLWTSASGTALELGEGARVAGDGIRWVDLLQGTLFQWSPHRPSAARVLSVPQPLGFVEPWAGGGIAAAGTGLARVDGTVLTPLTDTGLDAARYRVNDGTVAPDGSVWFGTMVHDGSSPDGALWRWNPGQERPALVLAGIDIPNGPAFAGSGTDAILADTAAGRILRVTAEGRVDVLVDGIDGAPDGLFIDDVGRIWNPVWGRARVDIYAPDGERSASFDVPAQNPTSLVITGGPDAVVAVTSSTLGLTAPDPLDGHTIVARLADLSLDLC